MKFLTTFLILFFGFQLFSQKTIEALHISEKIHIDGNLNEISWKAAKSVNGFTQIKPVPGKASARETKVAMLYSHDAVYISAICYDNKDSISKVLSLRDDYNANLDVFSISIDTYNDNQNGFYFAVTSQGVQLDAKMLSTDFNDQLNLVWNSKVTISDSAWITEIRIPFSAIRFPKKKVQSWGINFG
ncbi:MAG: hydrolase, partial [Crocinitomicaceae bacterium]|nr:hydrolase [Crocinitomicaceae bacterium]